MSCYFCPHCKQGPFHPDDRHVCDGMKRESELLRSIIKPSDDEGIRYLLNAEPVEQK